MSRTLSRTQRLVAARSLPATRCPSCDVPLERVAVVSVHLKRCDDRLAAEEQRLNEAIAGAGG